MYWPLKTLWSTAASSLSLRYTTMAGPCKRRRQAARAPQADVRSPPALRRWPVGDMGGQGMPAQWNHMCLTPQSR